ncbi:MAG: T9SS type A sorting domain-containing protein [Saprospiraceae bacterium]
MMTWALNYDHYNVCNDNTLEFAHNYEALFLSGCETPDLGVDIDALCCKLPLQLQSNTTTGTGVVYTWVNISTGNTLVSNDPNAVNWIVHTPGTYEVTRTADGCIRSDEVVVATMLDVPQLSGAASLCEESPLTVQVANDAEYDVNANWQWYKDGQIIAGATATTLTNITEDGIYSTSVTWGICEEEAQHEVDSDLPIPQDACIGSGEQALLAITNTDPLVDYTWYDAAQGGNLINTGLDYTTPTLSQTTTYYVQSGEGAGTASIGLPVSGNGLGTLTNTNYSNVMTFDVHTAFTWKEVTVFPLIYGYNHPFNIEVRDAQGDLVPGGSQSFNIQHPGPYGSLMGQYRLVFTGNGIELTPGNDYTFNVTTAVKNNSWSGSVSYPLQYGSYVTFTQSEQVGWFQALHDWLITTEGCAQRVPVTAEVDPGCAFLPVTWLSVSATSQQDDVAIAWKTMDEYNTSHYEVERMGEDQVFYTIGWVEAKGMNGTPHHYNFIDKQPLEGTAAYRIRQWDADGSFAYSDIVQVVRSEAISWTIQPNPVRWGQSLHIFFPEGIEEETKLSLYDLWGHEIGKWSLETELKNFTIPISDFQAGSYILHLTNNTARVSQIVVVQ